MQGLAAFGVHVHPRELLQVGDAEEGIAHHELRVERQVRLPGVVGDQPQGDLRELGGGLVDVGAEHAPQHRPSRRHQITNDALGRPRLDHPAGEVPDRRYRKRTRPDRDVTHGQGDDLRRRPQPPLRLVAGLQRARLVDQRLQRPVGDLLGQRAGV